MSRISLQEREALLHEYYRRFHQPRFLEWDPLLLVREFEGRDVQEYVALLAGLMAFGGVKQILASLRKITARLELHEHSDALNWPIEKLAKQLDGFTHRVYVGRDLALLTSLYQESRKRYGSLGAHFLSHHEATNETIEQGLTGVIADYKEWASVSKFKPGAHFKHMLNSPEQGSTCKRWLMYLKWMIRADDGIDLGLWREHSAIRPDHLLIPLDTHLFKISKKLGLTKKNTPNFKMSIEVTRALKKTDPLDPTRFDFSLCRFGMFDYRKILSSVENETDEG
jgi:uncharacterized protein (TIGR02757 family)